MEASGNILAIDPGPTESAWLIYDPALKRPVEFIKQRNELVLDFCREAGDLGISDFAIEMIQHYGPDMHAGKETFDTCVWIGRFIEAGQNGGCDFTLLYRPKIKAHVCGMTTAKDKNVRQALIDRWGGETVAKGKKKTPGPLYGIANDCWSALAIAVTFADSLAAPSVTEGGKQ